MMRHWLPTFGAILMLSTPANAEDITGTMRCEITAQAILVVEDGIPVQIEQYSDGPSIGDIFTFTYTVPSRVLSSDEHRNYLLLELSGPETDHEYAGFAGPTWPCAGEDQCLVERRNYFGWRPESRNFVTVDSDFIAFGIPSNTARFTRYYRGDWQGTFFSSWAGSDGSLHSQIFSLDCRQDVDRIPEVIDALLAAIERERDG